MVGAGGGGAGAQCLPAGTWRASHAGLRFLDQAFQVSPELCALTCRCSTHVLQRPVAKCLPPLFCVPGKVAIQKEDLQKYHNRDTWFQLQHVDADSEVQVRWGGGREPGWVLGSKRRCSSGFPREE